VHWLRGSWPAGTDEQVPGVAARAHDKDGILNVGEEIDNACENCHKTYWYPNEQIPPLPSAK